MDYKLERVNAALDKKTLVISGSKSETNRLLILKALYPELQILNVSDSDDSKHLAQVLASDSDILDIGHAGTAMRFGTAYFAAQAGKNITLTGSSRMKERPIGILVDALSDLGAHIEYVEKQGYPPLKIAGTTLNGGSLTVNAGISSQFLTALLLIAPTFKKGLNLHLEGTLTSRPYLAMTVDVLKDLGVEVTWYKSGKASQALEIITVAPCAALKNTAAQVESDWSSAGYWYSWVALQPVGYTITLNHFKKESLQGDSKLAVIYKSLGVTTFLKGQSIVLTKVDQQLPDDLMLDLSNEPDQAQTIFATCIGLGVNAQFTGLQTLKIKETDRIEAMRLVGSRFRESEITTTNDSIKLQIPLNSTFNKDVLVDTYQDHRMAMAFAPLCMRTSLIIKDAGVVSKSYGAYWDDLKHVNVQITEI